MTRRCWCVFQIGAREHYAIPRALHQADVLRQLYTDAWVSPGSSLTSLPTFQRLAGRFHRDLAAAPVKAPRLGNAAFELRARIASPAGGWPRTMARNTWFERWACRQLRAKQEEGVTVFSYSYAARALFQLAKERGWDRVLGQIDPGPAEEQRVAAEHRRYPQLSSSWQPAPPTYWQHWADEIALADRIVVNSHWSWQCLQQQGVPDHKLQLIPLVYEPPEAQQQELSLQASPPEGAFQLLFLGTIGLRKGMGRLLEAMRLLDNLPVQLTLAGPSELDPQAWAGAPNIRWIGPVPRSRVAELYRQAHAMILPTLSDGFALTQLEALAYNCPVIASEFCGEVVSSGVNGWLLPSLEPEAIAATIREAMVTVNLLPRPLQRSSFGLTQLAEALAHPHLPQING